MAKLTSKERKKLPDSKFAGPGRSYPVPDKSHAANAKARASQAVNEVNMSKSTKEKIDAKADKVLHKKSGGKVEKEVSALKGELRAHEALPARIAHKGLKSGGHVEMNTGSSNGHVCMKKGGMC